MSEDESNVLFVHLCVVLLSSFEWPKEGFVSEHLCVEDQEDETNHTGVVGSSYESS